jgi:hypothetical protein
MGEYGSMNDFEEQLGGHGIDIEACWEVILGRG